VFKINQSQYKKSIDCYKDNNEKMQKKNDQVNLSENQDD
jgi:hypothetical protein